MNYSHDLNTIGGRLADLFNSCDSYKLDNRGGLNKAISDMFKGGILEYRTTPKAEGITEEAYQKGLKDLHSSDETNAYNQIKDHLLNITTPNTIWIKRYALFFGCSADYLLGIIERPTHELTDVNKRTGLSDQAIKGLFALKNTDDISIENLNKNFQLVPILNDILSLNNGLDFEMLMRDIRDYLISDYLIPATHDKKGNPIFPESEYDCSVMPIEKEKQYYQTLYRSKKDLYDYVVTPITKERREAEAIFTLSKHLASIKNDLENNK